MEAILFALANVPILALICLGMWALLVGGLIWQEVRDLRGRGGRKQQ